MSSPYLTRFTLGPKRLGSISNHMRLCKSLFGIAKKKGHFIYGKTQIISYLAIGNHFGEVGQTSIC